MDEQRTRIDPTGGDAAARGHARDVRHFALDTQELAVQLGIVDRPRVVPFEYVPWRRTVRRMTASEYARFFRERLDAVRAKAEIPLAFYFHVPFCTHFCRYCRCYRRTLTELHERLERYTDFVLRQLDYFAPWLGDVEAAYWSMGGGTPSVLSPRQVAAIFDRFSRRYRVVRGSPVPTFEMSLPTVTAELADVVAQCGFRRVSLGVQTLDPRIRSANDMPEIDRAMLERAVALLQARGFLVNVDLIAGLEGEPADGFLAGFEAVMDIRPASCVVNVLERGSPSGDQAGQREFVRAVGPRMRALAGRYGIYPHGRDVESVLFLSPEFEAELSGHRDVFARLASGVRAVSVGTSTFAFGTQCESAVFPDTLVTNVDVSEPEPEAALYVVNYKGLKEALHYRAVLNRLSPAEVEIVNAAAALVDERFASARVESDLEDSGLRIRFDDPEQPEGRGEVSLSVQPERTGFRRVGRYTIGYGPRSTAACREVMAEVEELCRREDAGR